VNILASAILRAAGEFLHAGYMSATPRTLDPYRFEHGKPLLQLEVKEALRLEGETLVQGPAPGDGSLPGVPAHAPDPALAAIGPAEAWIFLIGGTGLFFLSVALAVRLRSPRQSALQPLLIGILALGVAGALFAGTEQAPRRGAAHSGKAASERKASKGKTSASSPDRPDLFSEAGGSPSSKPAPWEGVARRAYVHPADATRVILFGLIADGLTNVKPRVESLAEIQDEVGFPNKDLSEGQRQALKTYGFDGWGNPLRFRSSVREYRVASAGPDGRLDTGDDILLQAEACGASTWDDARWAHFIRKKGDRAYVFFHRWSGGTFLYRNRAAASAMAGSDLFDVAAPGEEDDPRGHRREAWPLDKAGAAFDAAAPKATYDPLVLYVIRPDR
jgi:hypothetical protein